MEINDFLTHFDCVTGNNGQYMAKCPVHGDNNASLSIAENDGKILLCCHAGCEINAVLQAVNLSEKDLFSKPLQRNNSGWKFIEEYIYNSGQLKKVRYIKPDGSKTFVWKHFDSNTNKWENGKSNITPQLYNQEVLSCCNNADTVYIVEGEKDVNTLKKHSLPAVSSPNGAGAGKNTNNSKKWTKSYTNALAGFNVAIIQDNDETGKEFAQHIANELLGVAQTVKIIDLTAEWTNLPEHSDITDVFSIVKNEEQVLINLQALTTVAKEYCKPSNVINNSNLKTFDVINAHELYDKEIPPLNFIVNDLLPEGISILAAPPKYGKSYLCMDLCLAVACGTDFLGFTTQKSRCLYLALEDSNRRLQNRMKQLLHENTAALNNLAFTTSSNEIGNGLEECIESYVATNKDTRLIIVDTFQKVRKLSNSNKNVYAADYKDTSTLQDIAKKHHLCILLVHHTKKGADENDAFAKISGSNGITGAMDTMLVMSKENRSEAETTLHVTGRDIEQNDYLIEFDKNTHKWIRLGNSIEIEQQAKERNYRNNPVVKTIVELLQKNNGKWSGVATDLMLQIENTQGTVVCNGNTAQLSRMLKQLKQDLYTYDGIIYQPPQSTSSRTHSFNKANIIRPISA